mmetsp:Transcript_25913/g.53924  ORF Transcript_25913/g.53924 Transcript_25913/m.53924 type:complete len:613 (+) Transcript_25913:124-1962(+)
MEVADADPHGPVELDKSSAPGAAEEGLDHLSAQDAVQLHLLGVQLLGLSSLDSLIERIGRVVSGALLVPRLALGVGVVSVLLARVDVAVARRHGHVGAERVVDVEVGRQVVQRIVAERVREVHSGPPQQVSDEPRDVAAGPHGGEGGLEEVPVGPRAVRRAPQGRGLVDARDEVRQEQGTGVLALLSVGRRNVRRGDGLESRDRVLVLVGVKNEVLNGDLSDLEARVGVGLVVRPQLHGDGPELGLDVAGVDDLDVDEHVQLSCLAGRDVDLCDLHLRVAADRVQQVVVAVHNGLALEGHFAQLQDAHARLDVRARCALHQDVLRRANHEVLYALLHAFEVLDDQVRLVEGSGDVSILVNHRHVGHLELDAAQVAEAVDVNQVELHAREVDVQDYALVDLRGDVQPGPDGARCPDPPVGGELHVHALDVDLGQRLEVVSGAREQGRELDSVDDVVEPRHRRVAGVGAVHGRHLRGVVHVRGHEVGRGEDGVVALGAHLASHGDVVDARAENEVRGGVGPHCPQGDTVAVPELAVERPDLQAEGRGVVDPRRHPHDKAAHFRAAVGPVWDDARDGVAQDADVLQPAHPLDADGGQGRSGVFVGQDDGDARDVH